MADKLYIRKIEETRTYFQTCVANSGNIAYVSRDARELRRILVGIPDISVREEWREMTESERALFSGAGTPEERY